MFDALDTYTTRRTLISRGTALAGAGLLVPGPLAAYASSLAEHRNAQPGSAAVTTNLDFAFHLYSALAAQTRPGANLFVSPLSIWLSLAMARSGARGGTATAMARTLGLGALPPDQLNSAAASLLQSLHAVDSSITLSIANSLWHRQTVPLVPSFISTLQTSFGADAAGVNFDSPAAPGIINAWVKSHTHGLIPTIVRTIDPSTVLYLINALYLKAPWQSRFDARSTMPGPFTLADGTTRTLPMMHKLATFNYYSGADYQLVRLPYGAGALAMYIMLPAAHITLAAFGAALTASTWQHRLSLLAPMAGSVILPRFSISYEVHLARTLAGLGMAIAFDRLLADFSGMIQGRRAFISDVVHKTVMRVDEQGTLAAAVTSTVVGTLAVLSPRFTVTVNRPFFCAIRNETNGTLLFMGSIASPQP